MLQTEVYRGPVPVAPRAGRRMTMAGRGEPGRAQLESMVREEFGQHFRARIDQFMPALIRFEGDGGGQAVIGLRRASDERLFLEQYLARPVEDVIAAAAGRGVERHRIAEIGQLAVSDREVATQAFLALVPFLIEQDFDWVCFTATNRIRGLLSKIGFHGLCIASASLDHLGDTGMCWGSYYEYDPEVIIGRLDDPQGSWCAGNAFARLDRVA